MKLEMLKHEYEGKLITFCGLDGCGKTTQIKHLVKWLEDNGHKVYLTKQPTDFVRKSEIFRAYMDTPEHDAYDYRALSLLCASDRVQYSNRVISQKLKEGCIVISDRYFYSCLANLMARGFQEDMWIYEVAKFIPQPDIAFFLDIDADTAVKRVLSREAEKDRFIDVPLQHRLWEQYIEIAKGCGGVILSTAKNESESFNRIKAEVNMLV